MGDLLQILCDRHGVRREGECLVWTRGRNRWGYGIARVGGRNENGGSHWMAHRLFYHLLVAAIPEGFHLHHVCANKSCVNPQHLQPLSPQAHFDADPNHPKNYTHCKNGHAFSPENVRWRAWRDHGAGKIYNTRRCRECARIHLRNRYARQREARLAARAC